MKGVISMKLQLTPQEVIAKYTGFGCCLYQFSASIHPVIAKTSEWHNIIVFHVPKDLLLPYTIPHFEKALSSDTERSVLLRDENIPVKDLEFVILHEFGHILNNDHNSEEDADEYARAMLTTLYGSDKAWHMYRHWLFAEYHLNRNTGVYTERGLYKHRKEELGRYVAEGLDNYTDDFD
jgi:hypothetical protein